MSDGAREPELTPEQGRVIAAAIAYIRATWTDDHPLEIELREAVEELTSDG